MKAIYFTAGKHGYNKKSHPGDIPTDNLNRLPVYRVVNEFMNLESKAQEDKCDMIQEKIEEQLEPSELQRSSRSLDARLQKKTVKYVMMNPGEMMDKEEVNSVYLDESTQRISKDKEDTRKEMYVSRIGTVIKGKDLKQSIMDLKTERPDFGEDGSDKTIMQFQLEKEKILRKNLQNSYNNLLNKLRREQKFLAFNMSECDGKTKNGDNSGRKTVIEHNDQVQKIDNSNNGNTRVLTAKMRSSCCELNGSRKEIQLSENEKQNKIQKEYMAHLNNEKMFQNKLVEQLQTVRNNIKGIERSIMRKQIQLQREIKQKLLLRKEKQFLTLNLTNAQLKHQIAISNQTSNNKQSALSMRQHLHYLFTIVILFLVLALVLKKSN